MATFCCIVCLGVANLARDVQAAGFETLVPDNTRGFLWVANLQSLDAQWSKTQLGELMNDPAMRPFRKDLRRQFEEQFSRAREHLGLTVDDLRAAATGEVTAAIIQPGPGKSAIAILADVTGNLAKANGLMKTVTANQIKRGAQQRAVAPVEGTDLLMFDLPPDPRDPQAVQAVYFLRGNLFCAADSLEVVAGILGRVVGKAGSSLADYEPFQYVIRRCTADAPGWAPQIRWFIQPLGYIEASRASTPPDQLRKNKTMLDLFQKQGFSAVKGVGGYADLNAGEYELLHRTALYAPPPYEKSMKMMVFPNTKVAGNAQAFVPESWVPRDLATYSTFYFNVLNAFDNFGPLFDFQTGEPGDWDDVLRGLKDDPNGPRIDLRNQLVRHLDNRVSVLTDYQTPINSSSERTLIAVLAKNVQSLQAGVRMRYMHDKTVRRRVVPVKGEDLEVWETKLIEKPKPIKVELEVPGDSDRDANAQAQAAQNGPEPLFPQTTVTVAFGYLLVASHPDFLDKILQAPQPQTLAGAVDYGVVGGQLQKLAPDPSCARLFSRSDEEYRVTYELIRQNKMPESRTLLARLLNSMASSGRARPGRQQKIDGRQMPDYDIVRRHLGLGGTYAVSEPDGWFLKGFMLPK
jgi:hypothetical protein